MNSTKANLVAAIWLSKLLERSAVAFWSSKKVVVLKLFTFLDTPPPISDVDMPAPGPSVTVSSADASAPPESPPSPVKAGIVIVLLMTSAAPGEPCDASSIVASHELADTFVVERIFVAVRVVGALFSFRRGRATYTWRGAGPAGGGVYCASKIGRT
jgi:hypothetical protein